MQRNYISVYDFFSNRINGINVRCLDFGISYSEVGKDFS